MGRISARSRPVRPPAVAIQMVFQDPVQAVMLNLLQELKQSLGMSYLFVSHDLNVVRLSRSRVIVMRAERSVEQGPTERVLSSPQEQYTRDLRAAIPDPRFADHV
jgi:peptide/nickel transport system ATP-binding protein